jgi:hypothetical protein
MTMIPVAANGLKAPVAVAGTLLDDPVQAA